MQHLTQAYIRELFDYCETGLFCRKISVSHNTWPGQLVSGSVTPAGYCQFNLAGRKVPYHRAVWFWHHGTWPERLDHINNDPSDNRIENLRECTHTQNMWNAKGRAGQTGIKGVVWEKSKERYRVRMRVSGQRLSFGYFKTLDEARSAVQAARIKHHGEFARHD
jgi:hypothetical protein